MQLTVGKSYYGKNNRRLILIDFDASTARLMEPIMMSETEMTLAAFEAWCAESDRRTYIAPDGEVRTKIATFAGPDGTPMVQYLLRGGGVFEVPEADWLAWRETAV